MIDLQPATNAHAFQQNQMKIKQMKQKQNVRASLDNVKVLS